MRRLTQAEVDALPTGTEVTIRWSGGNGPHKYTLKRELGVTCAYADGTFVADVDFVGAERYHTWVSLEDCSIFPSSTCPTSI